MYTNSRFMNKRCSQYLYVLTKNTEKLFSASGYQSRNFSLVKQVGNIKFLSSSRIENTLEKRQKLHLSSSRGNYPDDIPKCLMNFTPVARPEIFLSLKNWILAKFIIQPYLDKEFTLRNFTVGAKQALECVSTFLSQGDLDSLKGLVTDEAIAEIRGNLASFSMKERQDLVLRVTDVLFAFPYQIGIIFDDSNQRRYAEITVVYHCLNDYEDLKNLGKVGPEVQQDIKICNYRFIREYTKGVDSDWTINRLGHFRLRHFEN